MPGAGRPRAFPPFSGRFFANLHRDFGYAALALLAAHIGLMLYAEPLLVEHLKPSAPQHMLAGLLASLFMLLLVLCSITRIRKLLWQDYHLFRRVHAVLAVLCVGFLMWHVVDSGYYLNTSWKLGVMLSAVALVLGWYGYARYRHLAVTQVDRVRNSSRFSHWLSYGSVSVITLLTLGLLLLLGVTE